MCPSAINLTVMIITWTVEHCSIQVPMNVPFTSYENFLELD